MLARDRSAVTRVLVDTSVLVKWFHSEGEAELSEARAVRTAHQSGEVRAHILDLGLYELGNVLVRALAWPPDHVADQLADLLVVCGNPLAVTPDWLRDAATLAARHRLSFYDAAWAAAARGLGLPLVSADRQLLGAHLAESPTHLVQRLRLPCPRRLP